MKKINHSNLINSKSHKNLKISSEKENLINLKLDKRHFPILCSLYDPTKNFNYDLNNIKPSLKRSATEDFKRNIHTDTVNTIFLEENSQKENSKQENINNNINKNNYNIKRKNNYKIKLKNKKKFINKNKEEKNKDFFCNIPDNQKDSLLNVITVREAKEMKRARNNQKFKSKPKVKKFENIEIVRLDKEINFIPKLKSLSNINYIEHIEVQINPITNKKFKNLEIVQVTKEKLNTDSTKKFENMDICQTEKDFHIIDIKNINYIKSDTISENFSGENLKEKILSKIEVKHIENLKYNPKNKKIFSNLEKIKENEFSSIDPNKAKKPINTEENKEDNNNYNTNINNIKENEILLNNNNLNAKEIYNQTNKRNILTQENNNQNESEINDNKNSQNIFDDSKENSKDQKKSSSNDKEEFDSREPGLINHIYLKSVKSNVLNTNPRNKDYSQINNQYDSDSRINNTSRMEKIIDKSSIEPIKIDSQNYSKLIQDIGNGEVNIYSNENNKQNDKNKELSNKEKKSITDVQFNDNNCITFKENKTNNSNKNNNKSNEKKMKLSKNQKEKTRNNNKEKENAQKSNKRRKSENIKKYKIKSDINSNKIKNKIDKDVNLNKNKIKLKENNDEKAISEKNNKINNNYIFNAPNFLFPKKENNLNKNSYNSINSLNNNKKIKTSSEKNRNNKNNEDTFSSLYIRSKHSLFNDSRKSTQKQEEIQ